MLNLAQPALEEPALAVVGDERERARIMQFTEQVKSSGHYRAGDPLQPTSTATSVRLRHGKPLVTDGPFAETREQLGGYYLIDANNLDEAVAIAARIPSARLGTIEVRPVMAVPESATA
jgi:hypothetical protein